MIARARAASALLCSGLIAQGCAWFEPAYPEPVSRSFAEGHTIVSEMVAAVDLGTYRTAGSYRTAAPDYAEALGKFATTRLWVEQTAKSSGDRPLGQAATLMLEQIDECTSSFNLMAEQHKRAGLTPNAGYVQVRNICAIPLNNILQ